jgi:hypothetical protein
VGDHWEIFIPIFNNLKLSPEKSKWEMRTQGFKIE